MIILLFIFAFLCISGISFFLGYGFSQYLLQRQLGEIRGRASNQKTSLILVLPFIFSSPQNILALLLQQLQELRNKEEELTRRYELLTTHVAASIIICKPGGEILFCSPYTEVLTGYSLDEIYEHHHDFFERIIAASDLERFHRAQTISELGQDTQLRYQIRHRNGMPLWLESRMVPVSDHTDEVQSVMSVSVDVTQSVNYQKQIEEQNRDVSDFAYMVSHDLKAPIFTIKGMASALLEDYATQVGKEGQELLQYILQAAKRLEQLIVSVIEYSAISTKRLHEDDVDLRLVLDTVLQDFAQAIKETKASVCIPPDLPLVRGEQMRFYQVFSNLIGNALKYRSPSRSPQIHIRVAHCNQRQLLLEVQDNGLGIPAEKLNDIFRPYHRAHGNNIEGSGIGLACVKKIVEQLGGTVSATSILGEGSVFSVFLPLSTPRPQAIPKELVRCFQKNETTQ